MLTFVSRSNASDWSFVVTVNEFYDSTHSLSVNIMHTMVKKHKTVQMPEKLQLLHHGTIYILSVWGRFLSRASLLRSVLLRRQRDSNWRILPSCQWTFIELAAVYCYAMATSRRPADKVIDKLVFGFEYNRNKLNRLCNCLQSQIKV